MKAIHRQSNSDFVLYFVGLAVATIILGTCSKIYFKKVFLKLFVGLFSTLLDLDLAYKSCSTCPLQLSYLI